MRPDDDGTAAATPIPTAALADWLVLVVDDEPLIGEDVAISLRDAGAHVVGPMRNERDALHAIRSVDGYQTRKINGAVLDINLGDHTCERVAKRLEALGVPFVLHTGNWHTTAALVERLNAPVVGKPATGEQLVEALAELG